MHMPLLERMNVRFRWDFLGSPPARFAAVIREMARRIEPALVQPDACERIFLARKPELHRKLVNHAVIEAIAQARGFKLVYAEELSFREQASLLRYARFVVAPEGSALFLAFFARPGTRLCILEHPHTAGLPLLTGPLNEIGVNVTVFTGPFYRLNEEWPHMSDYSINDIAFARFLDEWLTGAR
jgi:capsular polysaccharide biosynthesis protein